jgi:hypothetical protein
MCDYISRVSRDLLLHAIFFFTVVINLPDCHLGVYMTLFIWYMKYTQNKSEGDCLSISERLESVGLEFR